MSSTFLDTALNHEDNVILKIISAALEIPEEQIDQDLSYQSVAQWDSLKHIKLMLALEKHYGFEIDEKAVLKLSSVNNIKEHVYQFKGLSSDNQKPIKNPQPDKKKEIYRGLNEIYYDNSEITYIDGQDGKLMHYGYGINDLFLHSTFEEVSYLLLNRRLPTRAELQEFSLSLSNKRVIKSSIIEFVHSIKSLHPAIVLRTVVSAYGLFTKKSDEDFIKENLIAQLPGIIAAHHAIREGRELLSPRPDLSHAANFLYLLRGEEPSLEEEEIFNQDLILHADHGSNASTFVARTVTGTQADIVSAVTAAISAFSGDLHGGALEKVMIMIREINSPDQVSSYIEERIKKNLPVFGYGHRVYRTEDPRAKSMRKAALKLSTIKNEFKWYQILEEINGVMSHYSKHGINVNVDFYAAIIYLLLGIPQDMFVSVFIMSRISGWIAQISEQKANNILIRPRLNYIGPAEKTYQFIDQR